MYEFETNFKKMQKLILLFGCIYDLFFVLADGKEELENWKVS